MGVGDGIRIRFCPTGYGSVGDVLFLELFPLFPVGEYRGFHSRSPDYRDGVPCLVACSLRSRSCLGGEGVGMVGRTSQCHGYGNQRMALGEPFLCGGNTDGGRGLLPVVMGHLGVLESAFP